MQLEYFQLVDRVLDLNLPEKTIRVEAQVPQTSTIFEGHFPGHPLMPGVLLIESMAQTCGWVVIALTRVQLMPLLAAVKDAKLRAFVEPGQMLSISSNLAHEGSGFAVTSAAVKRDGKLVCNADL